MKKKLFIKKELNEDEVQTGCFCVNCNDWVWYDIRYKYELDETIYHLKVCLKEVENLAKKEILRMSEELSDKKIAEDQIEVYDFARNIEGILRALKTYDIAYEIQPPYPYKIIKLKKELTEEDIKRLIAANPGLKVTAEELNAL